MFVRKYYIILFLLYDCVCSNDGVFEVALHVHVQVYSNGRVTWTPPALFRSSCGVKVRRKFCNLSNIQSIWTVIIVMSIGKEWQDLTMNIVTCPSDEVMVKAYGFKKTHIAHECARIPTHYRGGSRSQSPGSFKVPMCCVQQYKI